MSRSFSYYRVCPNTVKYIKKHIKEDDFEIAGELIVNQSQPPELTLNRLSLVEGRSSTSTVSLPPSRYNFHTHPHKLYSRFRVCMGSFSTIDIDYILTNREVVDTHYLFTYEGCYVIQINPSYSNRLNTMHCDRILAHLSDIESLRRDKNTTVLTKENRYKLNELFQRFDTLRCNTIGLNDADDKVFNIVLILWNVDEYT